MATGTHNHDDFAGRPRVPRVEPMAVFGRGRVLLAAATLVMALVAYWHGERRPNVPTVHLDDADVPAREVLLGRRAGPFLAAKYGGLLDDPNWQRLVSRLGRQLVRANGLDVTGYDFDFYVLASNDVAEVFPLPGGQVYVTAGLLEHVETEGELAGVLAYAMGHVLNPGGRAGLYADDVIPGVPGGAVLAEIDPDASDSLDTMRVQRLVEATVRWSYAASDNQQADRLAVGLLAQAGFHPEGLVRVWQKLSHTSSQIRRVGYVDDPTRTGPPVDATRLDAIRQAIERTFPDGLPESLTR